MKMKRKLSCDGDAVADRTRDGTSALGLEVAAKEERSKKSNTENKGKRAGKRARVERRGGRVETIGDEAITLLEDCGNEQGKRKEDAEDLKDVAAPSGDGDTAVSNPDSWGDVQKTPGVLSVKLGNLSEDNDAQSIRAFLNKSYHAMNIESIRLFLKNSGRTGRVEAIGYVNFCDEESVEAAVKLNGTPLLKEPVKITYAAQGPPPLEQWDRVEWNRVKWERVQCENKKASFNRVIPCFACGQVDGQVEHDGRFCVEKGVYSRALRTATVQSCHTYFDT